MDRIKIANIVVVKVISLDDAPQGYGEFDAGEPKEVLAQAFTRGRRIV